MLGSGRAGFGIRPAAQDHRVVAAFAQRSSESVDVSGLPGQHQAVPTLAQCRDDVIDDPSSAGVVGNQVVVDRGDAASLLADRGLSITQTKVRLIDTATGRAGSLLSADGCFTCQEETHWRVLGSPRGRSQHCCSVVGSSPAGGASTDADRVHCVRPRARRTGIAGYILGLAVACPVSRGSP